MLASPTNPTKTVHEPTAMRSILFFGACCLTALPAAAQGSISDTIVQKDGARLRGVEVTAMTKNAVTYKKGATESTVPASKVASVQWDGAPNMFGEAMAKENQGSYGEAADLYIESASKTDRVPLQLEAKFFGARAALADGGADAAKAAAAGTALQTYLSEAPDGFYVPNARLLIGRALRLQGKAAEAEAAMKQLEDAILTEGWGVAWDAHAKFERARALLAMGDGAKARAAYQEVISAVASARASGDNDPQLEELKTQSLVGEGDTYIADNKPADALRFFRRYSTESADVSPTVRAAALAGIGQALFLEAEAAADTTALREAQKVLAEACIVPGTTETAAKALYFSGKVLLALGSDHAKNSKARANSYFDTVVRYYGTTPWAAPARAEVSK